MTHDEREHARIQRALSRRLFLLNGAIGIGGVALAGLMSGRAQSAAAGAAAGAGAGAATPFQAVNAEQGMLGTGQIPARVKRVIWLHMWGAVSQVDTFDYKPTLIARHGQETRQNPLSLQVRQRI